MKYRGVKEVNGRWVAQFCAFGKQEYLGCFDSPEEAAKEYDSMVMTLIGDYSRINFPNEQKEPNEITCKKCRKLCCVSFFKYKIKEDGRKKYNSTCSLCLKEKRKTNNDLYLKNNNCSRTTKYRKETDYFNFLIYRIKHRCNKKNIEMDIDSEFLNKMYIDQNKLCALSGCEMTVKAGEGVLLDNASVDRIDNSRGYLKTNVQLVCFKANTARNVLSIEEFVDFCKQVVNCHNEKFNGGEV